MNLLRTILPSRGSARALFGTLMVLAACMGEAEVAAQSCAFLAPGVAAVERAPDALSNEAMTAAASAMSDSGLAVLRHEDVQTRLLTDPHRGCHELDCASLVATSLGVDVAVLVTVWTRQGQATSVVVTLIDQSGESYGGDAEVTEGVAAASHTAAATAYGRWEAAQMGRLIVHTVPEGARVEVDGREVGVSPVTRLVPAGIRQVRAVLGDARANREVQIAAQEDTEITLEMAAESVDRPAVSSSDPTGHIAVASVLGVSGLALIGAAIGVELSGSCADALPDGRCAFGTPSDGVAVIALSIAGGALLAGGIVWLVAALTTSGGSTVQAYIAPGLVGVRGSF